MWAVAGLSDESSEGGGRGLSVLAQEGVVKRGQTRLKTSSRLPEGTRAHMIAAAPAERTAPILKSAPRQSQSKQRILGGDIRGQFLLVEQPWGIIGCNVVNALCLVFDGPQLTWREL